MERGTILILNGTSSAGKTTLAKALQEALGEPYLHLGIDTFLPMLPERYLDSTAPGASQVITHDDGGHPRVEIRVGAAQHQLILGMYHAVAALATCGNNILLDDVIFDLRWLRQAVAALEGFPVFFIGIHCPLPLLEQRECERGDRRPGLARGLLATVHQPGIYDLDLHTAELSPAECVEHVLRLLAHPPAVPAFERLRVQL